MDWLGGIVRSPLPDVTDSAWTQFVALMGYPSSIHDQTPSGHLGLFLFHPKRLDRLRMPVDGFLDSPKTQYKAFEASCKDYLPFVKRLVSKDHTLSGLLGVAHRAGLRGTRRWVKSDEDQRNHPITTATFHATNGVF